MVHVVLFDYPTLKSRFFLESTLRGRSGAPLAGVPHSGRRSRPTYSIMWSGAPVRPHHPAGVVAGAMEWQGLKICPFTVSVSLPMTLAPQTSVSPPSHRVLISGPARPSHDPWRVRGAFYGTYQVQGSAKLGVRLCVALHVCMRLCVALRAGRGLCAALHAAFGASPPAPAPKNQCNHE